MMLIDNYLPKLQRKEAPICLFIVLLILLVCHPSAAEEVSFVMELKGDMEEPVDVAIADTGDIYVLDRDATKIFVFNSQGEKKYDFGQAGSGLGQLNKPNSIALSKQGDLLIADTGNHRVGVFDISGQFLYELGSYGYGNGQFINPVSVAVDPFGFIYVADDQRRTVTKFSPKGVFLSLERFSDKPTKITFDIQRNMYVLMRQDGKIVKHSLMDDSLREIVFDQNQHNYLFETSSFAVDRRGDIYLFEIGEHTIKKIGQDEELLFSFGSQGPGRGQFEIPRGITADTGERIYVADTENKRVQVLEITESPKPYLTAEKEQGSIVDYHSSISAEKTLVDLELVPQKGLYALSDHYSRVLFKRQENIVFENLSEEAIPLKYPQSFYVHPEGNILVANTGGHQLQFLNDDGSANYAFGAKGKNTSEFQGLQGVAVSQKGYIYVADTRNNRIQIFNEDGIYLDSFGKESETKDSPEPGMFYNPTTLLFDSQNRLYVLDRNNKRIQIFDDEGHFIHQIGGVESSVQFAEPVDIALDEKDYLYVADRGDYAVSIIDPQGNFVMKFGSQGRGPSHFPKLSALESHNGKIYVADYEKGMVRIYDFDRSHAKEDRLYVTKVFYPPQKKEGVEIDYNLGRNMIIEIAVKEFAKQTHLPEDILKKHIQIENEEILQEGQLKLTASILKDIGAVDGDLGE